MSSKQSCKSHLLSPKKCGAVPNSCGASLSVRAMLNFCSLSSARNLSHSNSVMPSELFLPFFPKGTKYWLLVSFLPYSTWRITPSKITRQSIENESSREMIASLSLKLVMVSFPCTLESHLQTSWNTTRLYYWALQAALLSFTHQQKYFPLFLVVAIGSDRFIFWGNFKYCNIAWDWYFILQTGHLQLKLPAD